MRSQDAGSEGIVSSTKAGLGFRRPRVYQALQAAEHMLEAAGPTLPVTNRFLFTARLESGICQALIL
jgi:hypothetical protein